MISSQFQKVAVAAGLLSVGLEPQCVKRPAEKIPVPSGLCAKVDARWLMEFALRVQDSGVTVETECLEVAP